MATPLKLSNNICENYIEIDTRKDNNNNIENNCNDNNIFKMFYYDSSTNSIVKAPINNNTSTTKNEVDCFVKKGSKCLKKEKKQSSNVITGESLYKIVEKIEKTEKFEKNSPIFKKIDEKERENSINDENKNGSSSVKSRFINLRT